MKWMKCAGATSHYPTDGRGGVTGTSGSSSFADSTGPWDNRVAVLHSIYVSGGASGATVAITDHGGSSGALSTITVPANGVFEANLQGTQLLGIKVVTTGANCDATLFFEIGQTAGYTAT